MRKIITLLTFIFMFAGVDAQTMHTLIFVNTQENTERGGNRTVDRTLDYNNMKDFFSRIAKILGYTNDMRAHKLQSDFTQAAIDREINNLDVRKNDIVVFYYSGHGANSGNDIWPSLCLMDNRAYWQTEILRKLKSKCSVGGKIQTKLLMCIADCCNGVQEGGVRGSFGLEENAVGVKNLFTGFRGNGVITMSSSIKGQLSISDLDNGSLFGIALREAISEETRSNSVVWETVFNSTKRKTKALASRYIDEETGQKCVQVPQFSMIFPGDPLDY